MNSVFDGVRIQTIGADLCAKLTLTQYNLTDDNMYLVKGSFANLTCVLMPLPMWKASVAGQWNQISVHAEMHGNLEGHLVAQATSSPKLEHAVYKPKLIGLDCLLVFVSSFVLVRTASCGTSLFPQASSPLLGFSFGLPAPWESG